MEHCGGGGISWGHPPDDIPWLESTAVQLEAMPLSVTECLSVGPTEVLNTPGAAAVPAAVEVVDGS